MFERNDKGSYSCLILLNISTTAICLKDDLRKARSFAEDMQRDKHRIKLVSGINLDSQMAMTRSLSIGATYSRVPKPRRSLNKRGE